MVRGFNFHDFQLKFLSSVPSFITLLIHQCNEGRDRGHSDKKETVLPVMEQTSG